MKIVNRGFILIKPKQAFCDWAKANDEFFDFDEQDDLEGNVYLLEDEFFEYEPILEANFKKIAQTECLAVVDSEADIPVFTLDKFLEWFQVEIGTNVFDTLKKPLQTEEL